MEQSDTTKLRHELPRDLYYQIVHELRLSLPPPVSASAEDARHRDRAAIAQVASLLPANGEEVVLAAQFVAASAQSLECLRQAHSVPRNIELAMRCTAQAAAMMRQARGARTMLMRVQAERRERETDDKALDAANLLEFCGQQLMVDALEAAPAAPEPPEAAPLAAAPAVAPPAAAQPAIASAATFNEEAALLDALAELPDPGDWAAIPPALLQAALHGTPAPA